MALNALQSYGSSDSEEDKEEFQLHLTNVQPDKNLSSKLAISVKSAPAVIPQVGT